MVDMGNVPTWVGAGGAVLGAAVAGVAAFAAIKTLRGQEAQLKEQMEMLALQARHLSALEEKRQARQAKRVKLERSRVPAPLWLDTEDEGVWRVSVRNQSDAVVRDIEVGFGAPVAAGLATMAIADTEQEPEVPPVYELGPGRACHFFAPPGVDGSSEAYVYFTDSNEQRWTLYESGSLWLE